MTLRLAGPATYGVSIYSGTMPNGFETIALVGFRPYDGVKEPFHSCDSAMKYKIQLVRYRGRVDPYPEVLRVLEVECPLPPNDKSPSPRKVEKQAQALMETTVGANGWTIADPEGEYVSAGRKPLI